MKMGCLSGGIFLGALLILIGLVMILKVVFHVDIPIFRILFALLLIYWGIKVLTGGHGCCRHSESNVYFKENIITSNKDHKDYNVVFGRSVFDLTAMRPDKENISVEVNAVFGSAQVKINQDIPTIIMVNAAFAGARTPDGAVAAFGQSTYRTKSYQPDKPVLIIKANAVFGEINISE